VCGSISILSFHRLVAEEGLKTTEDLVGTGLTLVLLESSLGPEVTEIRTVPGLGSAA